MVSASIEVNYNWNLERLERWERKEDLQMTSWSVEGLRGQRCTSTLDFRLGGMHQGVLKYDQWQLKGKYCSHGE